MIPSQYKTKPLSELVVLMHQGINTAADKIEYENSGIPIIQSKHFTSGCLDLFDTKYLGMADAEKYKDKYMPQKGDILFSNIGTVGKSIVLQTNADFMFAWNVFLIRPDAKALDAQYLKFFFDYLLKLNIYEQWFTGGTVKFINKGTMGALEIPLPPLKEQQRIAAILDKADNLRRKRQQAIQLADEFLRSVFLDMFGDPVINSKGWDIVELGSVLNAIESGSSPKCDSRPANDGEWGILRLGAVSYCKYNSGDNKAVLAGYEPNPKDEIKPGDLLFTRKNTYELVAAAALVDETPPLLLMPDLIFRLKTKPTINKYYLWALLTHSGMRKKIQSLASGAAGSMPNISKANLRLVEIPLPNIETQVLYQNIYKKRMRY